MLVAKAVFIKRWMVLGRERLVAPSSVSMSWRVDQWARSYSQILRLNADVWLLKLIISSDPHKLSAQVPSVSTKTKQSIQLQIWSLTLISAKLVKPLKADYGQTTLNLDFMITIRCLSMRCARPGAASDTSNHPSRPFPVLKWVSIVSRLERRSLGLRVKPNSSRAKKVTQTIEFSLLISIRFQVSTHRLRTLRTPKKLKKVSVSPASITTQPSSRSKLSRVAIWWMLIRAEKLRRRVVLTTIGKILPKVNGTEHLPMSLMKLAVAWFTKVTSHLREWQDTIDTSNLCLIFHAISNLSKTASSGLLFARTILNNEIKEKLGQFSIATLLN